ncbi:MAG TPA: LptE family protein [Gemmatimonadaceae bacterium]|nr:LptE family protein [Gemmatimonadaceae bacterium]
MHRSGIPSELLALALGLAVAGCGVHYGFVGGGLPSNIRTMAVLPFDNQTTAPELQSELLDLMRRELQRRLGVRDAAENRADALVRGTITNYDVDIPVGFSADPSQAVTARRKLAVTVDVEIVDQTSGHVLFQRKGMRAEGEYAERAEATGRQQALERLVSDIVEGAQSQW